MRQKWYAYKVVLGFISSERRLVIGKDLRGKNLGDGITQRKDGRYEARFISITGKRIGKYFDSPREAANWLEKAKYEDKNLKVLASFDMAAEGIVTNDDEIIHLQDMTVDQWFEFWMEHIINNRSYNTKRNYKERYKQNIQPVIGNIKVKNVLPMHCLTVLTNMENDSRYVSSTIMQTYITMGTMFKAAVRNRVISVHPFDGMNIHIPQKNKADIRFLTVEEEAKFFEQAKRSMNYDQYALIADTGLRASEMIGLCWDSVDFDKGTINVNKILEYRYERGCWQASSPKTVESYREIPLTERAYKILRKRYEEKSTRYEAEELNQVLSFPDRITKETRYLDMKDLVFVNRRTGMPNKNTSYNTHLYKLCDEAGIKHFCLHAVRHTFATRCIERGVNPKALQKLLGHKSLTTTMDIYVGVSDETKREAVKLFEQKASDENA